MPVVLELEVGSYCQYQMIRSSNYVENSQLFLLSFSRWCAAQLGIEECLVVSREDEENAHAYEPDA